MNQVKSGTKHVKLMPNSCWLILTVDSLSVSLSRTQTIHNKLGCLPLGLGCTLLDSQCRSQSCHLFCLFTRCALTPPSPSTQLLLPNFTLNLSSVFVSLWQSYIHPAVTGTISQLVHLSHLVNSINGSVLCLDVSALQWILSLWLILFPWQWLGKPWQKSGAAVRLRNYLE